MVAHSHRTYDCIIVGGGLHGTALANRLLEETSLSRSQLTIVDPHDALLESFRRRARRCGMTTMRSTFVHHIGLDPFGLESFATWQERADELVPTVDYPPRPTLDLFLDHAEYVIDGAGLDDCHLQASVRSIDEDGDELVFDTTEGPLRAPTGVLAIGHGGRLRRPSWANGVAGISHVWGTFDRSARGRDNSGERSDADAHTVVVGGGITAGQLAVTLSADRQVTLVSRRPIEWAISEADPRWINWPHIESTLHRDPPGSSDRLERVDEARHTATMPPYLYESLDDRLENGRLAIRQETITDASHDGQSVTLELASNNRLEADQVVLATGFEPAFDHPFVERVSDSLSLERGARGIPMLDDATLAWRRADGSPTPLFVTGALALAAVGPYAPNIPGSRRSADRIIPAIRRHLLADAGEHTVASK